METHCEAIRAISGASGVFATYTNNHHIVQIFQRYTVHFCSSTEKSEHTNDVHLCLEFRLPLGATQRSTCGENHCKGDVIADNTIATHGNECVDVREGPAGYIFEGNLCQSRKIRFRGASPQKATKPLSG